MTIVDMVYQLTVFFWIIAQRPVSLCIFNIWGHPIPSLVSPETGLLWLLPFGETLFLWSHAEEI